MAIGFHYDDVDWESYENDMNNAPQLSANNLTISLEQAKKITLRYPTSFEFKYIVQDDGIYEKQYEYDQFGEVYTEYSRPVMSREAFVEAFEKYIKNYEEKER